MESPRTAQRVGAAYPADPQPNSGTTPLGEVLAESTSASAGVGHDGRVKILVEDREIARRRKLRHQRGVGLVEVAGPQDPVADAGVPVPEELLDRMRPGAGDENLELNAAETVLPDPTFSEATSSRPTPMPRCSGAATSMPNLPSPLSSR